MCRSHGINKKSQPHMRLSSAHWKTAQGTWKAQLRPHSSHQVKTYIPMQWYAPRDNSLYPPSHTAEVWVSGPNKHISSVSRDFRQLPKHRTSSLFPLSISSTSCPCRLGNNFKKFPEVNWWQDMCVWSLTCLVGARRMYEMRAAVGCCPVFI